MLCILRPRRPGNGSGYEVRVRKTTVEREKRNCCYFNYKEDIKKKKNS